MPAPETTPVRPGSVVIPVFGVAALGTSKVGVESIEGAGGAIPSVLSLREVEFKKPGEPPTGSRASRIEASAGTTFTLSGKSYTVLAVVPERPGSGFPGWVEIAEPS